MTAMQTAYDVVGGSPVTPLMAGCQPRCVPCTIGLSASKGQTESLDFLRLELCGVFRVKRDAKPSEDVNESGLLFLLDFLLV